MRKALIGLMMAGAALVPATAHAQRESGDPSAPTYQREGGEFERFRGRDANSEARQQAATQRAAPVEVAQRGDGRRGGGEWRGRGDGNRGGGEVRTRSDGNRGDGNRGGQWRERGGNSTTSVSTGGQFSDPRDAARYDRRARENAIRYGNPQQRQEAIRDYRGDRRDWRQDRRDDRRDWRQDRRSDRRDWNRGWRNDNRYGWQDWRLRNRNIFRLPPYYAPYRNYGYRRFSVGLILDRLFYDQRYWLSDPFYYRLPPAPYGTQWVRYYNDVLLVDVYTGEVIDVIHDFFW